MVDQRVFDELGELGNITERDENIIEIETNYTEVEIRDAIYGMAYRLRDFECRDENNIATLRISATGAIRGPPPEDALLRKD